MEDDYAGAGACIEEYISFDWAGESDYHEAQTLKDEMIREAMALLGLRGRRFRSWSKGRGHLRKKPCSVLLFGYGSHWFMIKEEGDGISEHIPWDKIAYEVCWGQNTWCGNDTPGDGLRSAVIDFLWRLRKF